jgi:rare lipoprotein A
MQRATTRYRGFLGRSFLPSGRALMLLLAVGVAACGRAQVRPTPGPAEPGPERGGRRVVQEGLATYYAPKFAGRRTASGDRYEPGRLTAAHRTLPFGTRVLVSRIDREGRVVAGPVVVRINDRGPYGRAIIDLSMAAARRLGMIRDGLVRIRLEVEAP